MMEAYCDAKARLFSMCRVGVVNGDDPWHKRLLEHAACQVLTYAEQAPADLRAENVSLSAAGVAFDAVTKSERQAFLLVFRADLWYIILWMFWERRWHWVSR